MSFKTVYQLDEQGFYLCETDAQESPLEPGVFLMPRGCVDKAPPKCKKGLVPRFNYDTQKWEKVSQDIVVVGQDGETTLISEEESARNWRNSELFRVDVIINKIEDFEIEGDSKVWRKYRVTLRNWPATEDFPKTKPEAP